MRGITIALMLFSIGSVFGQVDTEDDFIGRIANRLCERLSGQDYSGMSANEREAKLGLEMIGALGEVEGAFEALGVDFADENQMEAMGEKIGLKLVSICPEDFFSLFTEEMLVESMDDQLSNSMKLEGHLARKDLSGLAGFTLESEDGSLIQLIWLEPFLGEELLGEKLDPAVVYSIYFKEVDLYDPKKSLYTKRKVITGVEIK